MKGIKRVVFAGLTCALAFACSGNPKTTNGLPAPDEAITVSVQNNNWQDIDVYAVNGTQRIRLGNVTTARKAVFVLPPSMAVAPDLRIQIHPLAATRDYLSPRISASPGDVIEVTVVNSLVQTSVTVR